ncbi:TPA: protein translocase subunit SecD [Patescibacteria group bacterium]|nr:protein translocase subunit SecD [Patescibacteria group bacterium]
MNLTVVRAWALILFISGAGIGYYMFSTTHSDTGRHFSYGLDLVGGSHLVYEADTSEVDSANVNEAMSALRDVIEQRVNVFGVSEPLVQVEKASVLSESDKTERLIVELPGVTDLEKAIAMIGATPSLEFKLVGDPVGTSTERTYIETGLTGKYLTRANLQFSGTQSGGYANEPLVMVDFDAEGKELFANITGDNIGKQLAIFLDNRLISEPVINEEIRGGTAVISGGFTAEKARELVRNLNLGALPVPIELASTESVGASLGMETLDKGTVAGLYGISIVMLFLTLWYRLPGLIASVALVLYLILNLAVYLFIPVTITAAGLAGLVLSSGMAVDANILIFERMKDELRRGKSVRDAVMEGVARAWLPIRDGNLTSVLSAVVLFWFGTASVQGFALTLIIGILLSMFTAIVVTRTFLLAVAGISENKILRVLFLSGVDKK